jgi:endonuclease G
MNIRSLEKLTGIDFFCNLPGTVEDDVENRDINTLKGVWGL